MRGMIARLYGIARRFRAEERAAAVVEFALILPLLMLLYLGSIEASSLFTVDRRVEVISSTVADLVARWNPNTGTIAKADLKDYFTASQGIITPYPTTGLEQIVSVLLVSNAGVAKVKWSCGYNGATKRPNEQVVTLEPHMQDLAKGGYLVMSEVVYPYTPVLGVVFPSVINLQSESLFLPRFGVEVKTPTGGCPT